MANKLAIIALFIVLQATGQETRLLKGQVLSGNVGIPDVFIINKTLGTEVKTDNDGDFTIAVNIGDAVVVYHPDIISRQFIIDEDSFANSQFVVPVNQQAFELDEVIINDITPESLGLVPEGQRIFTPAERKLRTAGDFKPIHLLAIIGGGMEFDPILNAINGKTKMLKKAVETEHKVVLMEKINGIHTPEEITDIFKIPEENVNGFIYYIAEDKAFADAIKSKNDSMAKFLMSGLAVEYLKLLAGE